MKKYDKEIDQLLLDNEKAVLKKLEDNYTDALEEINSRIAELMGRADADMQHVVYQIEYQKALKAQTEAILKTLQNNKFETVSAYLTKCYDDGFISTLYAIQKQGVPLVFPINQEEVAAAIQHETNLSTSLYESFDMKDLQKKIAGEISRGFSTGALYSDITRNVASYAMIDKNKAMRIVRTEGHRITETAASNAQKKAKDRGADIVKIWDSTLDGKTRPSHMKVDGEIREIGKKFSNGLEFPGDPSGKAAEVINCRCRSRTDARWALEADETKMLGDVSKMPEERKAEIAKKLGVPVDTLDQYSNQIVPVKAKDYADFKRQYDQLWRYEGSALQKEAEERIAGYGKKTVANTGKSSKIESTKSAVGDRISSPINARNTARGRPQAITQFGTELNTRQNKLLENLTDYDARIIVDKSEVSMVDLAALTAATGDEFALFTKGSSRLVIRGNSVSVNITVHEAKELAQMGYKWSGHTHPGYDYNALTPSDGDYNVLKAFGQTEGVIYNSLGQHMIFSLE